MFNDITGLIFFSFVPAFRSGGKYTVHRAVVLHHLIDNSKCPLSPNLTGEW